MERWLFQVSQVVFKNLIYTYPLETDISCLKEPQRIISDQLIVIKITSPQYSSLTHLTVLKINFVRNLINTINS